MAQSARISRQTIIAIEQGHYSPSLERAFLIANEFGVGIEEVFGWEPDIS
jgi:putative transcriptional regulator